jgi:hypothetical protein
MALEWRIQGSTILREIGMRTEAGDGNSERKRGADSDTFPFMST